MAGTLPVIAVNVNVGTIDLTTFVTVRKLSASATSIIYDPFTGHLFSAGINGIAQIDPATGTVVSTWLNPQGTGNFLQNLAVTGTGHLIAFDANGLLRIWDFSAGPRLIGAAETIQANFATPTVLSGGLALATLPAFPLITSPPSFSPITPKQLSVGTILGNFVLPFQ